MMRKLAHIAKSALRGRRGQRGESLTEVLVAIAVGALALLMLAMAISTATHIAVNNREAMGTYYGESNAIAASESGTSLGTGTVSLSAEGESSKLALVSSGEAIRAQYSEYAGDGAPAVIVYESYEGGA